MRIIKTRDYDDMSRKAANIISAQVILEPQCVLGLATGSTPIGIYKQLIEWYNKDDIDFSRVTTFNLDEYLGLNKDNDQSYFYFMKNTFFKYINIDENKIHIPDGMAKDIKSECEKYDSLIKESGNIALQLLGLGHNGHIGFNEPDDHFSKGTHCVDLTESTIKANARFFEKESDIPTQALTVGIQTIMNAKRILMVVSGKDKADILYKTCKGPVTPSIPATVLQLHPNVTVVADEAALSEF